MSLVDEQQILQGKHVLLAEDNDLNAEIAIMILEAMGLIVERVAVSYTHLTLPTILLV